MTKTISLTKLKEKLDTVNPRAVESIEVELSSSCSSDMPFWGTVKIGVTTYQVMLGDIDSYYWEEGIRIFYDIIRESGLKYTCNEYEQRTCNGTRIWQI